MRIEYRSAARITASALIPLLLAACGGGSGDGSAAGEIPPVTVAGGECSVVAQNEWVYANMQDYYLFYDQVPLVDPRTFDSPDELLRTVRFAERDPFSFIAPAGVSDLAFKDGREFGLGYNWGTDDDGVPRITRVITDSPFGRAGVERGDIIVEIAGRPAIDVLEDREFFDAQILGTPEAPGDASWTFADSVSGERFTARLIATEYAIDTVRHVGTFTDPAYDGVIGYFFFDRFLETSEAELERVFSDFADAGVTDLVIDLRYNGGGRISIARKIADLVLGENQAGVALQSYRYNDKYAESENFELRVSEELAGPGLRRLVTLVTGRTASSSEIIAGGLAPLMNVSVVGNSRTSGKPYIQRGRDRCDDRLNAIEAEAFNAAGESVFGGIVPDCFAADDPLRNFGRDRDTGEFEGMLRAGLDLVMFGTCEPFVDTRARDSARSGESPTGQGSEAIGGATLDPSQR